MQRIPETVCEIVRELTQGSSHDCAQTGIFRSFNAEPNTAAIPTLQSNVKCHPLPPLKQPTTSSSYNHPIRCTDEINVVILYFSLA